MDAGTRGAAALAARESEEHFHLLLEAFRDSAILRLGLDGRITSWDEGAERVFGYAADEIVGRDAACLYVSEDVERGAPAEQRARALREGLDEGEGWRVRKDGSMLWASAALSPLRDAAGEATGFSCVIRDITQRKQAEEELRETEEGFRLLVEGVKDYAIFILDPDGRVTSWNSGAERIKGYRANEIIGRHHSCFYPQRDVERGAPEADLATALSEGRCETEGWRVRKDGALFWADATISPLHDAAGRLRGFSTVTRDVTERKRLEAELAHRALHDPLTGLPNRDLLLDRAAQAVARSRRDGSAVAVVFLDLDRFKTVNDSFGHSAGDALLLEVAERLELAVRAGDTVARFGGDEFVVLCEPVHDAEEAGTIAGRLTDGLEAPFDIEGQEVCVTASLGVAVASRGESGADALLRDADAAMYEAKARGKARVTHFDERMRTRAVERLGVERDLRRAVRENELELFYQPQIDIRSGRLVGVEALVRWRHAERGDVSPAQFIPVAEETGLITPIGEFVLREACRKAREWGSLSVAVNLSPAQLVTADVAELVGQALQESGADPSALCLEITETMLMSDAASSAGTLSSLKELGVQLAIDDFGTGYSSLSYLKRFPVTQLKIDSSFIEGLEGHGSDSAIVGAMIGMGHALGLSVVAEGVETESELAALRELGCDIAQGFYFSPAVPALQLQGLVV